MKFTIPLAPITKKNHQQIIYNKKTRRPMVIPSKEYINYERQVGCFIPFMNTIDTPVNVKAVFYMPTRRRVDLVNLQEALLDILVKYEVISDDNCKIVASMDGSYVDYDKYNPRTEVEICQK